MSEPFTAFVRRVRCRLEPGQRVLAAVAYDGAEPESLADEDRELARRIFGAVDVIPAEARAVVVAVCGARAGKSYVLVALRLLHLALTVRLDTLAPGEVASAVLVAPDLRLARQTLRYALGAARAAPEVARLVTGETADSFTLAREGGRAVVIECLPATRGGSALRGRSLVGAGLDESAFFRDAEAVVNDVELYRAVAPRVLPGGQTIIASTPWAEGGLLYDLFTANHGRPTTAIAAHAPTLLLRTSTWLRSHIATERQRDAENAAREFDAAFMAAGAGLFFSADELTAARTLDPVADTGASHAVGIDLGFRSDSSAAAAVRRSADGSTYEVVETVELRPARGAPLVPSDVIATFAGLARRYGARSLAADGHYLETVREHANRAGLALLEAPVGAEGKASTHLAVRDLLRARRLRLPDEPRLLAQLRAIVSRPTSGGGIALSSPRRAGLGHGDVASAAVLAVWAASSEAACRIDPPRVPSTGAYRWTGHVGRGY